jgi:hypothetical protein
MPGFKEEFCEDQPYENLARLSNNWGTPQRPSTSSFYSSVAPAWSRVSIFCAPDQFSVHAPASRGDPVSMAAIARAQADWRATVDLACNSMVANTRFGQGKN